VRLPSPARRPLALLLAAAVLPRAAVLLAERGDILASFTDKSDDFARTLVESGTYGFIPGVPSAYTQPLYGFFLVPIYATVGRHWWTVGLAQIAVATITAWLVYAIGSRVVSRRAGLAAALLATLHPYLIWHDVHLNREILDGLLAAALVLGALRVEERPSLGRAALLGAVAGLAILGNARLAFLPLVLVAWLVGRRGWSASTARAALVALAAASLVVSPWLVRNRLSVGCLALTTDARALWKANNANTYRVLAQGGWIDDVPPLPGAPPSPQDAGEIYRRTGRVVRVDECAQMDLYQDEVLAFWRQHPGEKARLAGQAATMLWQPTIHETRGRPGAGTWLDHGRRLAEPLFMGALYALAALGLLAAPRRFLSLALAVLAYQTLLAMAFAGATRYRVPWDFLLAVWAAAGLRAAFRRLAGEPAGLAFPLLRGRRPLRPPPF
jgi:hypothetical protein